MDRNTAIHSNFGISGPQRTYDQELWGFLDSSAPMEVPQVEAAGVVTDVFLVYKCGDE